MEIIHIINWNVPHVANTRTSLVTKILYLFYYAVFLFQVFPPENRYFAGKTGANPASFNHLINVNFKINRELIYNVHLIN